MTPCISCALIIAVNTARMLTGVLPRAIALRDSQSAVARMPPRLSDGCPHSAGIWRDDLRPGSGAADEANSRDYWRGQQARGRCKAAAKNRPGQPYEPQRRARKPR